MIAMLVLLPPSAIFSYLVARRTVRRLEKQIATTTAFQRGDYSARMPVEGEDKIARLQRNFNAIAGDLERALRELQAEREYN